MSLDRVFRLALAFLVLFVALVVMQWLYVPVYILVFGSHGSLLVFLRL